jgi:hypothetical protein
MIEASADWVGLTDNRLRIVPRVADLRRYGL